MPFPVDPLPEDDFDTMLKAARSGDKEAQGRLLDGMRPVLRRAARKVSERFVKRRWNDSDLVQEAIRKALEQIQAFQGCTPQQLDEWFSVILGRTATAFYRRAWAEKRDVRREVSTDAARVEENLREAAPAADELAVRHEEALRLADAIGRLSEDQARVVRLKLEALDWLSIGRLMNRSAGAAAELYRRACQELKKDLKDLD
jgi:RNA polymerase sigma factor (sigma-70 family)